MNILVRQARIIDPSSPFHLQTADLLIENGVITSLEPSISGRADQIIDIPGLHASPGWVDVFAHFCDPGLEFKETLETGTAAAAAGGYTDVMVIPNTAPVVHNKATVEYIVQKSRYLPVSVHPIGAITKNTEGKELAEMYDMHSSGAVAFSDGTCSIQSSGLLLKALQYLRAVDKVIIQLPDDRAINPGGLMNEGVESTRLGLPGRPAIAEELMIARDIELVKYTGSRLHFTGISTAKSVELIRQAKSEGLDVTCSVTPYHLYFCDEDLREYDTNLKVNPPLRPAADRQALQQAVLDGTIDCIASHHLPQDIDNKVSEFEYAKYGMTGLQTAFAIVRTAVPRLTPERLVELFATAPRRIFGLAGGEINQGSRARMSFFAPDANWTFDTNRSRSANSPFLGKAFTGAPLGIINQDKLFLNQ
ncbi:MAG TPA: dihydroorotase [Chitinophagaceae bacterium]